jgi:hypothetical protein
MMFPLDGKYWHVIWLAAILMGSGVLWFGFGRKNFKGSHQISQ